MGINKGLLRKLGLSAVAAALIMTAAVCTALRISRAGILDSLDLLAAEAVMPQGNHEYYRPADNEPEVSKSQSPKKEVNETEKSESSIEAETSESSALVTQNEFKSMIPTAEELAAYEKEHEGEETYPVIEFTSTQGNIAYGGVQVKNSSSADINIKEELEGKLGFELTETNQPQVLIYHTHTSESFLLYDTGYYYESFYPRSTDPTQNVCAVGEEITKQLNAAGIVTIHDTTSHDYPSYSGSYYRSYDTVSEYLKKYPSIKVVLDIHRDGIGSETQRSKPVFTVNGKKAAQMMILAGYNYDGSDEFKDWEYNLRFALQIQKTAQEKYPDMVRPLNFGDFMYNMNINTGSLLIEIGADSNTLEEVRYTGYLLGEVLTDVLRKNTKG